MSFLTDVLPEGSTVNLQAVDLTPTPTYDPLREPDLPENSSEIEYGGYLYYYHCMPCHGDLGQGLTDEFRQVWVEDHQNCWARGCHGGRPMDEGFPIPTFVPRVISKNDAIVEFRIFDDLNAYLHLTHPPQHPGNLADDEYHALSAYLWDGNAKPVSSPTTAFLPTTFPSIKPESTPTSIRLSTPDSEPRQVEVAAPTLAQKENEVLKPVDHSSDTAKFEKKGFLTVLGGSLVLLLLIVLISKLLHRS